MSLDFTITIRCNEKKLNIFKFWCKKANKEYQDVLREVIEAGPEGRMTITPKKEQLKALKELYK